MVPLAGLYLVLVIAVVLEVEGHIGLLFNQLEYLENQLKTQLMGMVVEVVVEHMDFHGHLVVAEVVLVALVVQMKLMVLEEEVVMG